MWKINRQRIHYKAHQTFFFSWKNKLVHPSIIPLPAHKKNPIKWFTFLWICCPFSLGQMIQEKPPDSQNSENWPLVYSKWPKLGYGPSSWKNKLVYPSIIPLPAPKKNPIKWFTFSWICCPFSLVIYYLSIHIRDHSVMYCLWNVYGIYCIDKIKHLESFKNLVKNVSNWHINDSVFHTFLSKNLLSIFFGIFYLSIHIRVYTVMYCLWNGNSDDGK